MGLSVSQGLGHGLDQVQALEGTGDVILGQLLVDDHQLVPPTEGAALSYDLAG